jgi:hypothetical protein
MSTENISIWTSLETLFKPLFTMVDQTLSGNVDSIISEFEDLSHILDPDYEMIITSEGSTKHIYNEQ